MGRSRKPLWASVHRGFESLPPRLRTLRNDPSWKPLNVNIPDKQGSDMAFFLLKKQLQIIAILCVSLLFLTACGASAATPVQEPTVLPEIITQWAFAASSNIEPGENPGSNSKKATGEPGRIYTCDLGISEVTAWTSGGASSWLEVYFETPVRPVELVVHHSYHPNQITKIEMLDLQGLHHEVDAGGRNRKDCPYEQKIDVSTIDSDVIGVRIWVDDSFYGKSAIDAVQLSGEAGGVANTFGTPTPLPGTPTPVPAAIGERSYADRPDDAPGEYQIHVVYLLFKGQKDLKRDTDGSIASSIKLANSWFVEQTGGPSLRFDTYQGELDITFKQFNITKSTFLENVRVAYDREKQQYPGLVLEDYYLSWIWQKADDLGLNAAGKYYIVYAELEHSIACGQSYISDHLGAFFLQTPNCGYGRLGVDSRAWATEFVLLHEVLHGIGFTAECAPHSIKDDSYHVNDSNLDLMYPYSEGIQQAKLDVGNDDYFRHNIERCPDLADSVFLDPLPVNAEAPSDWPDLYKLPQ